MKKRAQAARAKSARRPRAPQRPCGPGRGVAPAAGAGAGTQVVQLPIQCTLADAETLKLRLVALLKSTQPVIVDVGLVHRIDTASLQLLAAFAHERRSRDLAFGTTGASRVFAQAARLLGLGAILGA